MEQSSISRVEQVPLDKITVINPRARNRKVFEDIVKNIGQLGLKRPITDTRKSGPDGDRFDLVCGQGRLEAYRALGQTDIPALVVEATEADGLVMSLVENIARRQHRAIDLLHDIEGMKRRGYSEEQTPIRPPLRSTCGSPMRQRPHSCESRTSRRVRLRRSTRYRVCSRLWKVDSTA